MATRFCSESISAACRDATRRSESAAAISRAAASVVRVFLGLRAVAVKIIERAIRVKMYFFIISFLLLLD